MKIPLELCFLDDEKKHMFFLRRVAAFVYLVLFLALSFSPLFLFLDELTSPLIPYIAEHLEVSFRVDVLLYCACALEFALVLFCLRIPLWIRVVVRVFMLVDLVLVHFYCFYVRGMNLPLCGSLFCVLSGVLLDALLFVEMRFRMRRLFYDHMLPLVSRSACDAMLFCKGYEFPADTRVRGTVLSLRIENTASGAAAFDCATLLLALRTYFLLLKQAVTDCGGMLSFFDGNHAEFLFGVPLEDGEHAFHAVQAALSVLECQSELNKKLILAHNFEFKTSIGIHSGDFDFGDCGGLYRAMGVTRELAVRLEESNDVYKTNVLISEKTWNEVDFGSHNGEFVVRRLDRVRVSGFDAPVQLYNLVGTELGAGELLKKALSNFETALSLYLKRDFENAERLFLYANELVPDEASLIYAGRCVKYAKNGVDDGWQGIFTLSL